MKRTNDWNNIYLKPTNDNKKMRPEKQNQPNLIKETEEAEGKSYGRLGNENYGLYNQHRWHTWMVTQQKRNIQNFNSWVCSWKMY